MKKSAVKLFVLMLATSTPALAQTPPSTSLRPPPDAPPPKDNPPGPYSVAIESDPSLPTHTIYRPIDLTPFKGKQRLPIVSWGNGACANAGTLFKVFLTQVASHGYMVISVGPKDAPLPAFAQGVAENATSAANPNASAPSTSIPPAQSRDVQLIDAIDWASKENSRKGSIYYGHLNEKQIAVMGQSCGGLQAIVASSDPRVKTSIIWNSGTFPEGGDSIGARLSAARKESLQKFHAPVAYFAGGPTDIAYTNSRDDFTRINRVPIFMGNLNVGHGGTFRHNGAGWFGEVAVAWLDWQLKDDRNAAKYFVGVDCKLCTNPIWSVEKKKLD